MISKYPKKATKDGLPATRSGYPPFQKFKARLCGAFPLDFSTLSTPCHTDMVSVVLPVYNGAQFVSEAIESVLGQSWPNLELIIVDDGSTDETPWIIDRYRANERMRVIRQNNRKLPGALNAGFAMARGEFHTWISADNRMRPNMIELLVEYLRAGPEAEMVYADEALIGQDGRTARNRRFYWDYQEPRGSGVVLLPHDIGELNYNHNNYIGACFLYRAWAAKIVGVYDERYFGYEDYDYWMRMNALFRVAHRGVREPLYEYRLHPSSLSAREKELRVLERATQHLAIERRRRRFFLEPFDVTLTGRHRWYAHLARAYRDAGHNVFELGREDDDALYHYRVSRAFSKAIVVSEGALRAGVLSTGQRVFHAIVDDDRLLFPGGELIAGFPGAVEYPLLAAANSSLWRSEEGPEVAKVAVAEVGFG